MKRASYRHAIEWLGLNEDQDTSDVDDIGGWTTTLLVADLFGVESVKVAQDVARFRIKEALAEKRKAGTLFQQRCPECGAPRKFKVSARCACGYTG